VVRTRFHQPPVARPAVAPGPAGRRSYESKSRGGGGSRGSGGGIEGISLDGTCQLSAPHPIRCGGSGGGGGEGPGPAAAAAAPHVPALLPQCAVAGRHGSVRAAHRRCFILLANGRANAQPMNPPLPLE